MSGQPLQPHVDYKLWADTYYSLRSSPQARNAINWHVNYLRGIEPHLDKGLWPPLGPLDPTGREYPAGVYHSFQAPHLGAMRKRYPGLSAPVIIKSAFALLNVYYTGHTHAVFATSEAGRTKWPFMPPLPNKKGDGPADGLFSDAQDVAGPCIQAVANLIQVRPLEIVADFVKRVQDDQDNVTRYAHAPWPEIEQGLGLESGTIRRVFTTMKFNWVPGFGAQAQITKTKEPFQSTRVLAAVARWRVGIICRCGLGGMHDDTVVMHLLGDALSVEQKVHMAKR